MNVHELIEELQKLPPDMPVSVDDRPIARVDVCTGIVNIVPDILTSWID